MSKNSTGKKAIAVPMLDSVNAFLDSLTKEEEQRYLRRSEAIFNVAGQVRQLRQKAGLTQSQLAQKIGTTQSDISQLERGESVHGPSVARLAAIAQACGERLFIGFSGLGDMQLTESRIMSMTLKNIKKRMQKTKGMVNE